MAIRFAFLVYDSRSGSTLLAKYLAERLKGTIVTAEIGFDKLFKKVNPGIQGIDGANLEKLLYSGGMLRNFAVPKERVREILENSADSSSVSSLFISLMNELVAIHGETESHWIIIKNGSHAECWREIIKSLGNETIFIHIYRDPRAVINSKLRTVRPYHQYETMAWGGSLLAAIRWRIRYKSMQDAELCGADVLQIRYEDFVGNPEESLTKIANKLGCGLKEITNHGIYEIPLSERQIHERVISNDLDSKRLNAWQHELPMRDQHVIEAVMGETLLETGYEPRLRMSWTQRTFTLAYAFPGMLLLLIRHFFCLVVLSRRVRHAG